MRGSSTYESRNSVSRRSSIDRLMITSQRGNGDYSSSHYYYEDDDERLIPGTYLLPVKDPLFTVRLREYRRNRYEKVKQIETQLFDKISRTSAAATTEQKPLHHYTTTSNNNNYSNKSSNIGSSRIVQQRSSISTLSEYSSRNVSTRQAPINTSTTTPVSLFKQRPIKERYNSLFILLFLCFSLNFFFFFLK